MTTLSPAALADELRGIRRLVTLGHLADATERCAVLTQIAPEISQVWTLAADVAVRSGNTSEAERILRQAVACAPTDATLLIRHGQLLFQLGRRQEALRIGIRADKAPPADPALRDVLGTLLTHLEEASLALRHFQYAVDKAPTNANFRYNLAMAQRMVGQLASAEINLDRVIAERPYDAEAFHARSDLRKQTRERNHVIELESTLCSLTGQRASLPVAFALAKELEDLGEYPRSFEYLHKACQLYRASLRYDVADDVAVLEQLCSVHTREMIEKLCTNFDNDECIFVVGLPRSGTTLVERILGTHSAVFAAGEMDAFPRVAVEAVARQGKATVRKLDFVDRSLDVDFASLGLSYVEATRPRTGHTAKFTDKLPLNYLYAGLIHAALPKARFVAVNRQPMDTCYAMYRTLFAAAYPFSYDLGDLARYYVAWARLMRHWADIIGSAWLTVNYEDLVFDQEAVTRRLLQHCRLQWEPQCLEFSAQSGAVSTASTVQIRRPLHSDSVGKWRHYAQQLQPLAVHFKANGVVVR